MQRGEKGSLFPIPKEKAGGIKVCNLTYLGMTQAVRQRESPQEVRQWTHLSLAPTAPGRQGSKLLDQLSQHAASLDRPAFRASSRLSTAA